MQEPINQIQGETPSPSQGSAILTGAALLGGAALLAATPKAAHAAISPALTLDDIPGTGDVKILNYALALEALEANLYVQAVNRLKALNVSSSDPVLEYLTKFATVEAQHRDFLIRTIKSVNNGSTILDTALKGATFDFGNKLDTKDTILDFLIAVEDTGVQAYIGAVTYFTTKTYLPIAAAIQGTEARHTAALIAIKNLTKGTNKKTAPTPAEHSGRDGFIREGENAGVEGTPKNVLAGVSPFIVLPAK